MKYVQRPTETTEKTYMATRPIGTMIGHFDVIKTTKLEIIDNHNIG